MGSRLGDFLARFWRPRGTPYTPDTFGLDDRAFFLAVLRACPANSTLHLDQNEDETWVDRLREWSSRVSPSQFEADYYRLDARFADEVERLLTDSPASLTCIDQIVIKSSNGRFLMASIDNFAIITVLDEEILGKLKGPSGGTKA